MNGAHVFLRQRIEKYHGVLPDPATVAVWQREFSRRLDADMVAAKTREERLKLKALSVAGAHFFALMLDAGSQTAADTFHDMVSLATGERRRTNLDPIKPRTKCR
jgi:hypothetical protein